jgi:hypothetical protein
MQLDPDPHLHNEVTSLVIEIFYVAEALPDMVQVMLAV